MSARTGRVEAARFELARVRAAARDDRHPGGDRPAELRDVHLHEAPRRRRRQAVPHRLDKLVDTTSPALRDDEGRQKASLLGSEGNDAALATRDLERTEHAHFWRSHRTHSVRPRAAGKDPS
jgi:hypothetical protein